MMLPENEFRKQLTETKRAIAWKLRAYRTMVYELNIEQLAELSNISAAKLRNMEMGEELDIEALSRIAKVYDRKVWCDLRYIKKST